MNGSLLPLPPVPQSAELLLRGKEVANVRWIYPVWKAYCAMLGQALKDIHTTILPRVR